MRRAILLVSLLLGVSLVDSRQLPESAKDTNGQADTLRLVYLVLRHGERAPQDTYPNDPYKDDKMEPYGWGQLTNVGRTNQYNQGLFLRERYDEFLGADYSPEKFYLQTTGVDRTKMSGLLESAGLWKPNKEQTFLPGLSWQPIVLYYQPRERDSLLLVWNTCPAYTKKLSELETSEEVKEINKENTDLYKELSQFTGQSFSTPDDVYSLYGTLRAEDDMKFKLPEWTGNYYPDKLEPLGAIALEMNVYTDELKRLRAGPLIKNIVDGMTAKKDGTLQPEERKMFMYVGHDSTLANLLIGLNVWNGKLPDYNLMTILELHEKDNDWNVQIFLRNTTCHEPYPLTVPGCTTECPLASFVKLLEPAIPEDWEAECKVADGNYTPPPPPLP